jgi:hypothetical protein
MKRKDIDAAREVRLWIGQIIVPTMTLVATVAGIPEVRQAIAAKANEVKNAINKKAIERKFKKGN